MAEVKSGLSGKKYYGALLSLSLVDLALSRPVWPEVLDISIGLLAIFSEFGGFQPQLANLVRFAVVLAAALPILGVLSPSGDARRPCLLVGSGLILVLYGASGHKLGNPDVSVILLGAYLVVSHYIGRGRNAINYLLPVSFLGLGFSILADYGLLIDLIAIIASIWKISVMSGYGGLPPDWLGDPEEMLSNAFKNSASSPESLLLHIIPLAGIHLTAVFYTPKSIPALLSLNLQRLLSVMAAVGNGVILEFGFVLVNVFGILLLSTLLLRFWLVELMRISKFTSDFQNPYEAEKSVLSRFTGTYFLVLPSFTLLISHLFLLDKVASNPIYFYQYAHVPIAAAVFLIMVLLLILSARTLTYSEWRQLRTWSHRPTTKRRPKTDIHNEDRFVCICFLVYVLTSGLIFLLMKSVPLFIWSYLLPFALLIGEKGDREFRTNLVSWASLLGCLALTFAANRIVGKFSLYMMTTVALFWYLLVKVESEISPELG